METLKEFVIDQNKRRAAHDKGLSESAAIRMREAKHEVVTRLHDTVQLFLKRNSFIAKRQQNAFGEHTCKPGTAKKNAMWRLYSSDDMSTLTIVGHLFEDGSIYLYEPGEGFIFASDDLLLAQNPATVERLVDGVLRLQDSLERFAKGAFSDSIEMLEARLQFETSATLLWYKNTTAKQTFLDGYYASDEDEGRFKLWCLKVPEIASEYFDGNCYVQSDGSFYLRCRKSVYQHMTRVNLIERMSREALVALISAVCAIREPVCMTSKTVETIHTKIEESLEWCLRAVAQDDLIVGRIEKKPNSNEELVAMRLRVDDYKGSGTIDCGKLFSDGSLYWDFDGKLVLMDDATLLQQPMRSAHIITNAIENVTKPMLMFHAYSRIK